MNRITQTIESEDQYYAPFAKKMRVSIERGEGVYVFDEDGTRYIDFTSGWGVMCLGHSHPVIVEALCEQGKKIMQNPDGGKTYSPIRAKLLELMQTILPHGLTRVFFTNSGAEANDAAIKLARKVSGKKNVISTHMSFHGRTISTASATGQSFHRDKFDPLMPNYLFVPFNDINAVEQIIHNDVAALIVEPIQGESGIRVPSETYLSELSKLCEKHNVFLILDEIQTGFYRTGPAFCSSPGRLKVAFLTMAKGIAGGFPFGAFAMTEEISKKLEVGDHGGTYCGNPLGCAVSYAVIKHLIDTDIGSNVKKIEAITIEEFERWKTQFPNAIREVRGRGLLLAIECSDESLVQDIQKDCLANGLLLNVTQDTVIRIFPALNITIDEMRSGLSILYDSLKRHVK